MPDADATIATLARDPANTAFLVDFDGSLSTIVERAEDARPLPAALAVLERLVATLGRVGIVSGRPISFLREHVAVPGLTYTGLYGMQHAIGADVVVDTRVLPYLDAVAAAVDECHAQLPAAVVEPKDGVSVTLHWRPCPERADEIVRTATAVAERHGLGLLPTRMAIELRPPVAIDKGDAVRTQVEGFAVAAFAGDDTGDLPAFTALDELCSEGALKAAVRVGVHSPEAPAELERATDIRVAGPDGLIAYLDRLAEEIA